MKHKNITRQYSRNPYENMAQAIFDQSFNTPYLYSDSLPESRYSIKISAEDSCMKNDFISGFEFYGPNEKYILNKIYHSQHNTIFIIGGIGTGKSRFIDLIKNKVIVEKKHICENKCFLSRDKGLHVFIDCTGPASIAMNGMDMHSVDMEKTREVVYDFFNLKFRSALNDIIDFEKEITLMWDEIIKQNPDNDAVQFIKNNLRKRGALYLEKEVNFYENFLNIRREVYNLIEKDRDIYLNYLAALFRYIQNNYINGNNKCIIVFVDNLDQLSIFIQRTTKHILRHFFRASTIKGVICARQSTYRGLGLDGWAVADEVVPICGPTVINIIKQRIEAAIENLSPFIKDLNLNEDDKIFLHKNISRINNLLNNSLISNFITSIVGHSIRKGLLLAERLISNSVYDILKHNELKKGDVIKALLLGDNDILISSRDDGYIDNIYTVTGHDSSKGPLLIKLRLLRLLSKRKDLRDGLFIGEIYEYLIAFGYTDNLILNALNDLLHESKRLIWSNSILFYRDISDILSSAKSSLFISSAGVEYQDFLYQNIEYLQQAMVVFFTKNQNNKFNTAYESTLSNMKTLLLFLDKIIHQDIKEIHSFSNSFDLNIYKELWNGDCRLSLDILQSVKLNLEKIFKNERDREDIKLINSSLKAMIHECNNRYKVLYSRNKKILCSE